MPAQPARNGPGIRALELGKNRDGAILVPVRTALPEPAPLVLALHGAGGMAAQVLGLFAEQADAHGLIVLAPESRDSTWDLVRGGFGPDVAFIERALQHVFDHHAIDPARVAVAGFSDGASYALSLGLTNGTMFSDVMAFSPGFMAPARQSDAPRIFISHGTQDRVLPIDACSRRLVPLLMRAGYAVEYREFEGGHVVPADVVAAAVARFLN